LPTPKVSVVIAAYNSSSRLKCAVTSILHQSFADLEVVIVGDSCTDDTEEMLLGIGDFRIRWENLPHNWGEQSVPSNRAIDLAQGSFIFFLNQDDLWMPSHVEDCLSLFGDPSLDVVWSPYVVLPPGCIPGETRAKGAGLRGISFDHPKFDPFTFIPASCTAWRTEPLRRIGGWRTAAEVVVSPSQDLLWRANRGGLSVRGKAKPTVLVLWSGSRPGSYLPNYRAHDNESWLDALESAPKAVEREIEMVPKTSGVRGRGKWTDRVVNLLKKAHWLVKFVRLLRKPRFWVVELFGFHPLTLDVWARNRSAGGFINSVRQRNSLDRRDYGSLKRRSRL
jgi:glycosyltransferase involved in cell wall biosynthesis